MLLVVPLCDTLSSSNSIALCPLGMVTGPTTVNVSVTVSLLDVSVVSAMNFPPGVSICPTSVEALTLMRTRVSSGSTPSQRTAFRPRDVENDPNVRAQPRRIFCNQSTYLEVFNMRHSPTTTTQ